MCLSVCVSVCYDFFGYIVHFYARIWVDYRLFNSWIFAKPFRSENKVHILHSSVAMYLMLTLSWGTSLVPRPIRHVHTHTEKGPSVNFYTCAKYPTTCGVLDYYIYIYTIHILIVSLLRSFLYTYAKLANAH